MKEANLGIIEDVTPVSDETSCELIVVDFKTHKIVSKIDLGKKSVDDVFVV